MGDPFGWVTEACRLSPSEESRLRHCSYFGQSDSDDSDSNSDSDSERRYARDIPTEPVGFMMVTPPESPVDELDQTTVLQDQEMFHTPPESRSTSASLDNCNDDRVVGNGLDRGRETVAVDVDCEDCGKAVDLGRDTDLGFSEAEVDPTQRIEADWNQDGTFPLIHRESEEIRVLKRGFSPKGQLLTESPSRRLKSLDSEPSSVCLGTVTESHTPKLSLSLKENDGPSPRASSELELESQRHHEFDSEVGKGNIRKRRFEFLTDVIDSESEHRNMISENNNGEGTSRGPSLHVLTRNIECDTEERSIEIEDDNGKGSSRRNKNIVEDIDQFRRAGGNGSNSPEMEEKIGRKQTLPSLANERVGDDEGADEELETNETELGGMKEKTESTRALPSWANVRVGDDEEPEVSKSKLPSGANGRVQDDDRADEEVEVNRRELPSLADRRVEDNERADGEVDVNEGEKVHSGKDSDSSSGDFEEVTLLDVLRKLRKDREEDRSLECLSLLEVAQRKWGAFC